MVYCVLSRRQRTRNRESLAFPFISSRLQAFWVVLPTPRVGFAIFYSQNYANLIPESYTVDIGRPKNSHL